MTNKHLFAVIALSMLALGPLTAAAQEPQAAQPQTQTAEPQEPAGEPQAPAGEPQAQGAEPAAQPAAAPEPAQQPPAATPPGDQPPAKTVVGGVTSAASETAATLAEGGKGLVSQGQSIWRDVLVPMWQRFAAAIPGVVKALLVLAIFWVVAVVAGAAVRKLLGLTNLDERAARDWGLEKMLTASDGSKRSFEGLAGTFVKWLILLFGLVAFFQALDLAMVAGPLQGIVTTIVGVVPNLLQAAVILLVYWIIASLLRIGVSRGLAAVGFDEKAKRYVREREVKGEMVPPSGLVGRLVFFVVLLFGLPPFLDALGQRSLVAPLSQMLEQALSYIPHVVGAALIFVIGHLIGTIVREIVSNFLAAAGVDDGVRKLGLGEALEKLKVSEIAGSIAYFFIIIPVIGAAVDTLKIPAISEPVSQTLATLLAAIPLVFVAAIVVGVGYFLARIVARIVQSFLSGVGFDLLPEKLGLGFLDRKDSKTTPSYVVATAVMLVIILLTVEQALATLELHQLSDLIGRFIAYLPQVVVGLVVILAALSLSAYVARLVAASFGDSSRGKILSTVARYAVLFFGFGLGLNELGVGESLVTVAVAAVLGGAALALGLAFGLGGRERAQRLIEESESE